MLLSIKIYYLYCIVRDTGNVLGQQDQDGSCILSLGLGVFFCCEVFHLHYHTAAG